MSQFIDVANLRLEDVLLHCSPDLVINWVKIRGVERSLVRQDEAARLFP